MNESLEQMVRNYDPQNEGQENNNEETNINNENEMSEESQVVEENTNNEEENENVNVESEHDSEEYMNITNLTTWFRQNVQNFDNVFSVNATLTGVDPNKNLIMTVKDQNDSTGRTRYPYIFRGADEIHVLDHPGHEMFIFQNNTFQVNYNYSDELFVKSYILRKGMGIVFCLKESQNNYPVPVKIDKYKKINQSSIPVPDLSNIPLEQILDQEADIETMIIKYKQLQKFREQITTNRDLVNFFIERQSKVQDVNHLIQIDSIIASIFE